MSHRVALDTAEGLETAVAAGVLGVEAEHKVKHSLLQTELKEEIDLLNTEKRDLLEQLQQEIRLKEDLEKVSFGSWQRGHCDLWEQVAWPTGWLGCRSAQGSARSGLGECAPQSGPSFPQTRQSSASYCPFHWPSGAGAQGGVRARLFAWPLQALSPAVPPMVVSLSPGPPSYPVSSGLCLQQRFPLERVNQAATSTCFPHGLDCALGSLPSPCVLPVRGFAFSVSIQTDFPRKPFSPAGLMTCVLCPGVVRTWSKVGLRVELLGAEWATLGAAIPRRDLRHLPPTGWLPLVPLVSGGCVSGPHFSCTF